MLLELPEAELLALVDAPMPRLAAVTLALTLLYP